MTAIDRAIAIITEQTEAEFLFDVGEPGDWGVIGQRIAAQALADAGLLVTDDLWTWVVEALSALEAARTIGERHRTPLNYGNLDRLIDLGHAYLASRPS